jgi:hypothetical protein
VNSPRCKDGWRVALGCWLASCSAPHSCCSGSFGRAGRAAAGSLARGPGAAHLHQAGPLGRAGSSRPQPGLTVWREGRRGRAGRRRVEAPAEGCDAVDVVQPRLHQAHLSVCQRTAVQQHRRHCPVGQFGRGVDHPAESRAGRAGGCGALHTLRPVGTRRWGWPGWGGRGSVPVQSSILPQKHPLHRQGLDMRLPSCPAAQRARARRAAAVLRGACACRHWASGVPAPGPWRPARHSAARPPPPVDRFLVGAEHPGGAVQVRAAGEPALVERHP